MTHKCSTCGQQYELGQGTLPICPHCVKAKMLHPDGLSPKHTFLGALASTSYASYIGDGIKPDEIYNYMTSGNQPGPSGCELFYSRTHNSWNAVSFKPMGNIPGSGIGPSGPHAAEYAVLADIEGKSKQGPHWMFEDAASLAKRRANGDWTDGHKCAKCSAVWVLRVGDICQNCQSSAGGTTP